MLHNIEKILLLTLLTLSLANVKALELHFSQLVSVES